MLKVANGKIRNTTERIKHTLRKSLENNTTAKRAEASFCCLHRFLDAAEYLALKQQQNDDSMPTRADD